MNQLRLPPLLCALAIASSACAQSAYEIGFGQARYDVSANSVFPIEVGITPVPAAGLYSFGIRLFIANSAGVVVDTAAIAAASELDHHGVRGAGAIKTVFTNGAAIKGSAVFPEQSPAVNSQSRLATFRVTDLKPGKYQLYLDFFNTLGPTEQLLVAGDGQVLDSLTTFRSALVNHLPTVTIIEPAIGVVYEAPAVVPISVIASDPDGGLSRVTLSQNGSPLATLTPPLQTMLLSNAPTGTNVLSAVAVDDLGATSSIASTTYRVNQSVILLSIQVLRAPTLNRQTGLFEQDIRVSNTGTLTIAGVRVRVAGLSATTTLWNATGQTNGIPYVQHNYAVAPSQFVDLRLEYYASDRRTPTPSLTAEPILGQPSGPPAGTVIDVSRTLRLADGSMLVEFATTKGAKYAIQYTDNLTTWLTAVPSVTGNGTQLQWIDAGPPKTSTRPAAQPKRFYRVIAMP